MNTLFNIVKHDAISKVSAKSSHKRPAKGDLLHGRERKIAFVKDQLQLRTLLGIPEVSARI